MKRSLMKNKWPLIIFATAFLIRLIYLLQYRSNPAFNFPMVDEQWHLLWAKEIIGGNFWGSDAYFRGPLYPYLLAFFLKITGGSIFWVRFLQIIIASCSAVLVYLLGEKLFSKKAGVVAGFAFAAYATIFFYDAMLLISVIYIFLNLLAVYLLLKQQGKYVPWRWFLAGVVIGLSAIARPNILLLVPFFLLWIYLTFSTLKNVKKRLFIVAIYLAGILVPVLSVTLRNYIVTGEPILISSQGGVNLYIGNNPDAEGLTMLMPEVKLDESFPWTEFTAATRAAAEKEAGRELTAGQESSFWTHKAINFILRNPGKFIKLTFKKIVYFFVGFENSDQTDIYQSRTYSTLFSILLWKRPIYFPFGLVFPLALVGMIASWARRKETALLYVFIIGYIPTVVLFLVTARHRLAVVPFMLIFAAVGILTILDCIKSKNWRMVRLYSITFLVTLILSNRTYFDIGFENAFQTHFNLALAYEQQGNLPAAETEYREALEDNPYSATTLNNLGHVLFRQNKNDEALSYYNKAFAADPNFADAYNNAGLIYESRKDYVPAEQLYRKALSIDPSLYKAHMNLGDIYLAKNDFAIAETFYLDARKAGPGSKDPYFKLGALYARMKEFPKAEEMFNRGSQLGEPSAIDFLNWGNIYFSTKQPQKAIELYHKSMEKDTLFTQVYFNLALTFVNFGYPPDSSRIYLNTLLRINPGFAPARDLLQKLEK